jgi:hypothetical protein
VPSVLPLIFCFCKSFIVSPKACGIFKYSVIILVTEAITLQKIVNEWSILGAINWIHTIAKKPTTKIFIADFQVCLYELLILPITNIDNDSSDENYK